MMKKRRNVKKSGKNVIIIEAINKYLSHELYLNAFKNNVITLDHGIKKGEKFHRAIFLEYLATAYNSIKDMENIIIIMKNMKNVVLMI